jgi:AraC family transcriptional regulator
MNVQVTEMPEYHVCYVRQIGPYGPDSCGSANERLMHWAGPRGFAASGVNIGIAWDNPEITPPDKCRYDACLTVPVGTKGEGGGRCSDPAGWKLCGVPM